MDAKCTHKVTMGIDLHEQNLERDNTFKKNELWVPNTVRECLKQQQHQQQQ